MLEWEGKAIGSKGGANDEVEGQQAEVTALNSPNASLAIDYLKVSVDARGVLIRRMAAPTLVSTGLARCFNSIVGRR